MKWKIINKEHIFIFTGQVSSGQPSNVEIQKQKIKLESEIEA